MSDDPEKGARIIESHQELVKHIEQTAGRMRGLSVVTVGVAGVLALAYVSQLALPLFGTTTVTVNLADPVNVASELVVFALALVWLYVGLSDYRFTSRLKREISAARASEKEVQERISGLDQVA